MACVGRPTRKRAAQVEVIEERLWDLGDHEAYCDRIERRIALVRRFLDDMASELAAEREAISNRRDYIGRVAMSVGYQHLAPELLAKSKKAAGDTATFDVNNYHQEEEVA